VNDNRQPNGDTQDEDEDDGAEAGETGEDGNSGAGFGLPDVVRMFVKELADKVASLVVDRVASGGLNGLPLGALLDWRKGRPDGAAPVAPAAPAAAPATPAAAPTPAAPPTAPAAAPAAAPATAAPYGATPTPPAATPHIVIPSFNTTTATPSAAAGAAPSPTPHSPLGVAPAERPTTTTAAAPRPQEEFAAAINAHFLQVWRGLSTQERVRATAMIQRLTDHERTAWLSELAGLAVPDAIARARAFLESQPPTLSGST
jgi:hypothetical protein